MKANTYAVKYICGHTDEVRLFCTGEELERRLKEFRGQSCPECKRAAERREIERFNIEYDAPPLQGSVKQIAWAEALRYRLAQSLMHIESNMIVEAMKDYDTGFFDIDENGKKVPSEILIRRREAEEVRNAPIIRQIIQRYTDAAWYIDHRTLYDDDKFQSSIMKPAIKAVFGG